MDVFGFLIGSVLAFEGIISPLPDDYRQPDVVQSKPTESFQTIAGKSVLGMTNTADYIGVQTIATPSPSLAIQPSPLPTANEIRSTRKSMMTIAVIGDSMVDTLGPDIPDLQSLLVKTYPKSSFTLLNYGVGGTNIDYGIERLTHDYEYLGVEKPSLVSRRPDLVIIESFGYNPYPYDTGAIDKHWLALATMVDVIKQQLPDARIAIAVTIAPSASVFGDGAPGVSFSAQGKQEHVTVIKRYLESTVKFALSQHLPVMDAYLPSLTSNGNGDIRYINSGDHIHYSPVGRTFMAGIMMDTIRKEKLLE